MPRRAPRFWYNRSHSAVAFSLLPAGWVYGAATGLRMRFSSARRALAPVVCIGNPTVGGAGKTPVAIAMARFLARNGCKPGFLSRGYGGNAMQPVWVETDTSVEICGDEPLLLARHFPTVVSPDRPWGAEVLVNGHDGDKDATSDPVDVPVDVIVMDDGFHNPSLEKDLSFLVIDKSAGIGNGLVFPAGPLRMSLKGNLRHADAVIVAGGKKAHLNPEMDSILARCERRGLPVLHTQLEPDGEVLKSLRGKPLIAFAGIAHPEKFFVTLRNAELDVLNSIPFPDHHPFSAEEAEALVKQAVDSKALLITTEKDAVRFGRARVGPLARLREHALVLPIAARFPRTEQSALRQLLRTLPQRLAPPQQPEHPSASQ